MSADSPVPRPSDEDAALAGENNGAGDDQRPRAVDVDNAHEAGRADPTQNIQRALDFDFGDSSSGDGYPRATMGTLVERFVSNATKSGIQSGGDGQRDGTVGNSFCAMTSTGDLWLTFPDSLMLLILAKLPYPAFCSFRSVCKSWNRLMVYPDPFLMGTGDLENAAPLCVVRTADDRLARYSLSSHDWRPLPPSFGASFGELGFACGDQTYVHGRSGGLLILRPRCSRPCDAQCTFWLVNPVNKSERCLAPVLKRPGTVENHFVNVDDSRSSFTVFQVIDYQKADLRKDRRKIHLYHSETDSWKCTPYFSHRFHILSVTEFEGCIYSLVIGTPETEHYRLSASWILKHWVSADGRKGWAARLETCSRHIEGGRFWVRDGKLLLGAVYNFIPVPEEHSLPQPREGDAPILERERMSCVWELEGDDGHCVWKEVARMPEGLRSVLWTKGISRIDAGGDFMWISNSCPLMLMPTELDGLCSSYGVMCHVPTNSWWTLPSCSGGQESTLNCANVLHMNHPDKQSAASAHDNHGCLAFLFSPRMGLRL